MTRDCQRQPLPRRNFDSRRIVAVNRSGGEFRIAIHTDLEVNGGSQYLFRSLANLIHNALRCAADAGPISIAAAGHDAAWPS